jgi:hypothetical protein
MRESASTDLREPWGSNPLGPPGPELRLRRLDRKLSEPPVGPGQHVAQATPRRRPQPVTRPTLWSVGSSPTVKKKVYQAPSLYLFVFRLNW